MARKAGLGRGLDALFADVAPIMEDNASGKAEPSGSLETEAPEKKKAAEASTIAGRKSPGGKSEAKKSTAPKKAETSRTDVAAEDDRVIYVDINDIKPNSAQPRLHFDEAKLEELAGSIKANGVIQPLIVRESTNGYELVAGERRWRASRIAGLSRIPCIIRNFDDRQNAIVAIIENMQREDLNPIEEAKGLKSMTEKYGFTQEQVSASLGRSRTYIANSIRLLKLPPEIQEYVSSGQMTAAHGRTIINIPDKQKQKEAADKIIRNDLSVRATEKLAEKIKDELRPERKRRKKKADLPEDRVPEEIKAVETELKTLFGTKVNIRGDENKGRIELEYYSLEELNRIIDLLREAGQ